jgi:hypothetical protein
MFIFLHQGEVTGSAANTLDSAFAVNAIIVPRLPARLRCSDSRRNASAGK